jgi:hypothetical protein
MTSLTLTDLLQEYGVATAYSLDLIGGLESDQICWRPDENSSAIGWHLGHQAAVNHYMVRNLTAAEVTFNADFDAVFDSATPEPARGELPTVDEIRWYRSAIAESTRSIILRIADGDVGAPAQLDFIAKGLLVAVINHEYQHAKWVGEVRETMIDTAAPEPRSSRLTLIDGYYALVA